MLRVVLDEGQTIKSPRTHVAHAAWALPAERRWVLTGTPIQNAIDDLFSYFKFLNYWPYNNPKAFKDLIRRPVQSEHALGYQRLQAILQVGVVVKGCLHVERLRSVVCPAQNISAEHQGV